MFFLKTSSPPPFEIREGNNISWAVRVQIASRRRRRHKDPQRTPDFYRDWTSLFYLFSYCYEKAFVSQNKWLSLFHIYIYIYIYIYWTWSICGRKGYASLLDLFIYLFIYFLAEVRCFGCWAKVSLWKDIHETPPRSSLLNSYFYLPNVAIPYPLCSHRCHCRCTTLDPDLFLSHNHSHNLRHPCPTNTVIATITSLNKCNNNWCLLLS